MKLLRVVRPIFLVVALAQSNLTDQNQKKKNEVIPSPSNKKLLQFLGFQILLRRIEFYC